MPHFDYCDSLFTDLSVNLAQRLQRVHNVCVRYICNNRRSDHDTPSLEKLSWLRLRERRTFYWLSLLFNILNTSTPSYLSNRFNSFLTFTTSAPDLNNVLFYLFLHTTPHFTLHLSQFLLIKLGILSLCLSEIPGHYLNSIINGTFIY